MEKATTVEISGRSVSLHNLKYTAYVRDGDPTFGEVCKIMKTLW